MLGEPKNQFSLTRAALSTRRRAESNFLSSMEAMLKPRAQPASPPAGRRIIDFETVVLIDGTNRTPMKPALAVGQHESRGMDIPGPFGSRIGTTDNVTTALFEDPCAVVRSTSVQPVFEVNLPPMFRASDVLRLVRPKVKADRRLVEKYRSGTFYDPVKAAKKGCLPLTVEETTWTNSNGAVTTICRAKPSTPLTTGEYFFLNNGNCYDFGVGAKP